MTTPTLSTVIGTTDERCDGKRMFRYEWQAKKAVKLQKILHDNRLFYYHCKRCKSWHLATAGR